MQDTTISNSGKHIVVVGAGGNIGSHLVSHLARLAVVSRITLIDRDRYEQANLRTQNITVRNLGKAKATAQAQRVRQITPMLSVHAIVDTVEHVPLGQLRGDVIIACVDSRRARQSINQIAWHLGMPWIDAGVQGDGLLARVNVYAPGPDMPCLECTWDQQDYDLLEHTYPCQGQEPEPAPTNAPSSLGGLAAALQAIECQKLLTEQWEHAALSRQVLIDAAAHRQYVTTFQRHSQCRFDHETWTIDRLLSHPDELTLQQVFAKAQTANGGTAFALRIPGQQFVQQLSCTGCGQRKPVWQFTNRLRQPCRCGQTLLAAGCDLRDWLDVRELPPALIARSLRHLGVRVGDVLTLRGKTGMTHYQIGV
jgi:molybdopterin/thiamine biosynthesis adenylyltransferase